MQWYCVGSAATLRTGRHSCNTMPWPFAGVEDEMLGYQRSLGLISWLRSCLEPLQHCTSQCVTVVSASLSAATETWTAAVDIEKQLAMCGFGLYDFW
eukprot:9541511-Karenia_brevis.AAC.1